VRARPVVARQLDLPAELVDARRDRPRRARAVGEAEPVVVDADLDVRARGARLDRGTRAKAWRRTLRTPSRRICSTCSTSGPLPPNWAFTAKRVSNSKEGGAVS